ncbi:hypothetical protein [Streptomyces sp. NPDC059894]|uniref:hypothetical protein n=1 Tax=unclassified Streptomyces TaxID=2593676 RepID=UPI00365CF03A
MTTTTAEADKILSSGFAPRRARVGRTVRNPGRRPGGSASALVTVIGSGGRRAGEAGADGGRGSRRRDLRAGRPSPSVTMTTVVTTVVTTVRRSAPFRRAVPARMAGSVRS